MKVSVGGLYPNRFKKSQPFHTKKARDEDRLIPVTGCFVFRHQSVSMTSVPSLKRNTMERFRCRYYSDVSHCAYSFLSLFALRPLSSPESSFRPVTGPASV